MRVCCRFGVYIRDRNGAATRVLNAPTWMPQNPSWTNKVVPVGMRHVQNSGGFASLSIFPIFFEPKGLGRTVLTRALASISSGMGRASELVLHLLTFSSPPGMVTGGSHVCCAKGTRLFLTLASRKALSGLAVFFVVD